MEKVSGIYCFENLVNGKKYVGQASNLNKRIKDHFRLLYNKKDNCVILQKAWSKWGEKNFNFWIVEECAIDLLDKQEEYWIKELHSHISEWGYNVSWGGKSPMRGRKHTKESRIKITNGLIKRFKDPKVIEKYSKMASGENNPRFGVVLSDEFKKHQSEMQSGEKSWRFGKKNPKASSKYYGVRKCQDKIYPKNIYWRVEISRIYVGNFKSEMEAALAYDKYVIENNLPNLLNFPENYTQTEKKNQCFLIDEENGIEEVYNIFVG